jgi:hypothetical protein
LHADRHYPSCKYETGVVFPLTVYTGHEAQLVALTQVAQVAKHSVQMNELLAKLPLEQEDVHFVPFRTIYYPPDGAFGQEVHVVALEEQVKQFESQA